MLVPIVREEGVHLVAVDTFGGDVVVPVIAEQGSEALRIGFFGAECSDESVGGGFRGGEGLLRQQDAGQRTQEGERQQARCDMHDSSPIGVRRHEARGQVVVRHARRAPPAGGWQRRG